MATSSIRTTLMSEMEEVIMALGTLLDKKSKEYDETVDTNLKNSIVTDMVKLHNSLSKLVEQYEALIELK